MKINSKKWIWDPSWGWNGEIYYLSSVCDKNENTQFFNSKNALCKNNKIIYSLPNVKMNAGSFDKDYYYGSVSHDINREELFNPSDFQSDQSIFICNKSWEKISDFRPSEHLTNKSKFFSNRLSKTGKLLIPFRDPTVMPNGNLAVVTGGWRWDTFGNICEIKYTNNKWEIVKETILDDTLRNYSEIERPTFWEDFMFYSIRGALNKRISKTSIEVAKLSKNGFYKYYGKVKNTECCYGPCVDENLRLLFWYPNLYFFNNPINQNIFYSNKEWVLKEKKLIKHIYYQNKIKYKLYQSLLLNKFKKILRNCFRIFDILIPSKS